MTILPPDPIGIFEAVRRMGYGFHEAVADIVDNSIDASARNVLIRINFRDGAVDTLDIADDGNGMDAATLADAMVFGKTAKGSSELLGKYGLGMKAATFSQAETLTVASKHDSEARGRRWTEFGIRNDWDCETLAPREALQLLEMRWQPLENSKSGTVVRWGRPRRFAGVPDHRVSAVIEETITGLLNHLGLVLHRFVENSKLSIAIEVLEDGEVSSRTLVEPLDPFGYSRSGRSDYPIALKCDLGDLGQLTLAAHIWPANSNDRGYKLGGGAVAQRQGFYFYRNNRLIQSGGWNDWRNASEPHLSLARVAVDLPPSLDDAFSLNTQKHGVHPPPQFFEALKSASDGTTDMAIYIAAAQSVYRAKPPTRRPNASPCVPTTGLDRELLSEVADMLAPAGGADEMAIKWARLPADRLFEIDTEKRVLTINAKMRRASGKALKGQPQVMTQLERMLLFLLLRDEFTRRRKTIQSERWTQVCQALLTKAAKRGD